MIAISFHFVAVDIALCRTIKMTDEEERATDARLEQAAARRSSSFGPSLGSASSSFVHLFFAPSSQIR